MSDRVPAKPPGFLLKMRVLAPDGVPFRERPFRVKWGDTLYPLPPKVPFKTDGDGALSIHLGEAMLTCPQGELQFIDGSGETVIWAIPLQIADEPEPLTLEGLENVGPVPAPPVGAPSPDVIQAYDEECIRRRARVLAHIREHIRAFEQLWEDPVIDATQLPPVPPRIASDDELWDAWNKIVETAALAHDDYEAAFRLWNLADLPLPEEPMLPFMGSDLERLRRAASRFAYRHGLASDATWRQILDHLVAVHDKRGSIVAKAGS